ncbi:uncharacterized protein CC84DRAFT_1229292 [Paraphaeosphaeria sporulosa]|uniref:Uncharacterized protein n=1 Tax=Paraphaeosphaeria sporulosa TaxID=1460663 RepID=A0A177C1T8_9PLEO|nr:uncharacterized protein CC84DRAFT_1229292 [Paraphaeosphaeria sporulosa]OAG00778.1 hypothetical protein CC84DRAFT_1229292 [Paraphaeosphaeria sporulosa]
MLPLSTPGQLGSRCTAGVDDLSPLGMHGPPIARTISRVARTLDPDWHLASWTPARPSWGWGSEHRAHISCERLHGGTASSRGTQARRTFANAEGATRGTCSRVPHAPLAQAVGATLTTNTTAQHICGPAGPSYRPSAAPRTGNPAEPRCRDAAPSCLLAQAGRCGGCVLSPPPASLVLMDPFHPGLTERRGPFVQTLCPSSPGSRRPATRCPRLHRSDTEPSADPSASRHSTGVQAPGTLAP